MSLQYCLPQGVRLRVFFTGLGSSPRIPLVSALPSTQGYLAHEKQRPLRTLKWEHA
jgi:hypothetical protein